jgi:DNA-binding response OmpR family regulator
MSAHILQIAYYPNLLETRTRMLRESGYRVTSVLGNNEANDELIASADLVVLGFSAPYSVRDSMVHWLRAHHSDVTILVLQFHSWEKFPDADAVSLCEDPAVWLAAVASILRA